MLKVLFCDLIETPKVQLDLSTKKLSLMHLYWDKSGEVSEFTDFEARYCASGKGLMTTSEAKAVHANLEANFQSAMQEALDRIYDGCFELQTK